MSKKKKEKAFQYPNIRYLTVKYPTLKKIAKASYRLILKRFNLLLFFLISLQRYLFIYYFFDFGLVKSIKL